MTTIKAAGKEDTKANTLEKDAQKVTQKKSQPRYIIQG